MTNQQFARTVAAAAQNYAQELDEQLVDLWCDTLDCTELNSEQLGALTEKLWLLHSQLTRVQGEILTLTQVL